MQPPPSLGRQTPKLMSIPAVPGCFANKNSPPPSPKPDSQIDVDSCGAGFRKQKPPYFFGLLESQIDVDSSVHDFNGWWDIEFILPDLKRSSSNCIFQPLCIVWEILPPIEAPPNDPVLVNLVLLHVTLSEIYVQVVASEIT
ncbi:hypothetical protein HJC23_002638 [Cyclotella cryptica]|uniref:Uncharacterized protein n=1 Tax=Cyclotella cryptica TaxID=29204 RepID=A0ABD3PMC9_9STRA